MHKNKSFRFLEQLLPQLEKDQPFDAIAKEMQAAEEVAKKNKEVPTAATPAYLPPAFIAAQLSETPLESEVAEEAPTAAPAPASATSETTALPPLEEIPAVTPAADKKALSLPTYETERPEEGAQDELPSLEEAFLEEAPETAPPKQFSEAEVPAAAPAPEEDNSLAEPQASQPLPESPSPQETLPQESSPQKSSLQTQESEVVAETAQEASEISAADAALEEFDIPVIDDLGQNFSAAEKTLDDKPPKRNFLNEQMELLKQNFATSTEPGVESSPIAAPPAAEEEQREAPTVEAPLFQEASEPKEKANAAAVAPFEAFPSDEVTVEVPALEAEIDAEAPPALQQPPSPSSEAPPPLTSSPPPLSPLSPSRQAPGKTPQQKKAATNIAAAVNAETPAETERILDNDYLYQKVLSLIQGYRKENLETVLGAFSSDKFSDAALEEVAQLVLTEASEEEVVAKVEELAFSRDFVVLPPKKQQKAAEEKLVKEVFAARQAKRRVALLSAAAFFGLLLFLTYFFGYEALRARYHYSKAYTLLAEKSFEASEKEFQMAYGFMPNWKEVNKIAALYARLKRYRAAEEKYQLSLQINPQAPLTLTAYGKMFYLEGTFPAAVTQLEQALAVEKSYLPARELLAELYVEWGHQAAEKLTLADQLYKTLLKSNPASAAYYYSQALLVSVLRGNYPLSKFYYLKTLEQPPATVPKAAFSYYLYFLANSYADRNTPVSFETEQSDAEQLAQEKRLFENPYLINTAAALEKTLSTAASDYLPFYYAAAKWQQVTKNSSAGLDWAERGKKVYAEKGSPRYFPAEAFFVLSAALAYQEEKLLEALADLSQALAINPNATSAQLQLARLNLLELNQLEKAQQQLLLANANFPAFKPLESAEAYFKEKQELVYLLGYVFYQKAKQENSEAAMQRALQYWTELNFVRAEAGKKQRPYLFDYTLGSAYLFLKKYDLAQGILSSHLRELKNALLLYDEREEVGEEIRYRLIVLSELYNNLGVALLGKGEKQALPLQERQQALEYFINSIALKDKLGLLKGVPYANFFSLSATKTSTGETVGTASGALKIADEFFPKTLLGDLTMVYRATLSTLDTLDTLNTLKQASVEGLN